MKEGIFGFQEVHIWALLFIVSFWYVTNGDFGIDTIISKLASPVMTASFLFLVRDLILPRAQKIL